MKLKIMFALVAALLFSAPALCASRQDAGAYLPKEDQLTNRQAGNFSGNVKTGKYHNNSCKHYDCRDCTRYFRSKQEALKAGFEACKLCGG